MPTTIERRKFEGTDDFRPHIAPEEWPIRPYPAAFGSGHVWGGGYPAGRLGYGVLDTAMVETAAYCLVKSQGDV